VKLLESASQISAQHNVGCNCAPLGILLGSAVPVAPLHSWQGFSLAVDHSPVLVLAVTALGISMWLVIFQCGSWVPSVPRGREVDVASLLKGYPLNCHAMLPFPMFQICWIWVCVSLGKFLTSNNTQLYYPPNSHLIIPSSVILQTLLNLLWLCCFLCSLAPLLSHWFGFFVYLIICFDFSTFNYIAVTYHQHNEQSDTGNLRNRDMYSAYRIGCSRWRLCSLPLGLWCGCGWQWHKPIMVYTVKSQPKKQRKGDGSGPIKVVE
jgi:hypothetical protein